MLFEAKFLSDARRWQQRRRALRLAVVLLIVSVVFTAYSKARPDFGRTQARWIDDLFAPTIIWSSQMWMPIRRYWHDISVKAQVQRQNRLLQQRVATLKERIIALEEQETENRRLKALLSGYKFKDYTHTLANVVATDFGGKVQGITIDRGLSSGVKVHDPVVGVGGVVGMVTVVNDNSSKVLLVVDVRSGIDVRGRDSRIRGVVRGVSIDLLSMDFVVATNNVTLGEKIVTSGMDRIFPPGLLIGQVVNFNRDRKTLFKDVKVRPAVDFTRLEEVVVLRKINQSTQKKPEYTKNQGTQN
jgi:rod shape-determining protein MreC